MKVKDTGAGISEKDIDKLFAPYERIDEDQHISTPGSGLGMSIVVALLKLMDSRLEVESIKGKGSTFFFSITQSLPSCDSEKVDINNQTCDNKSIDLPSLELSGKRILVIDDIKTNLIIIKELLKDTGAQIDTTTSGSEGLAMLSAAKYDLLLLDDLMPEMSGIETLQKLREKNMASKDMPVIAMTANITSDAKSRYHKEGFQDLLEKPIDVDSFENLLRAYLL